MNGQSTNPAEAVAPSQSCSNCANLGTSGSFGPAQSGSTHRLFYRNTVTASGFTFVFDPTYCTQSGTTLSCVYTSDYTVSSLIVEAPPPETQYGPPIINTATSLEPVHTLTGSFSYRHTDLAIPGRGPSALFLRTYNANDTRTTALGPGWTHNYSARLRNPGDNTQDVIFVGPQGRSDRYTHNADGSYTPPPAVYTTLVQNADGSYTLTFKDRSVWSFNPRGQMTKIADRYGNASTLSYNSAGQPASVSDPAGRGNLILQYDTSGHLTAVIDWTNRTVSFAYDASGRLQSGTDREGKVTTFAYDGTTSHLTTITDARGNVAVTNTYDASGRVVTQQDAHGLITGQRTAFSYVTNADGTKTTTVTYPATSFDPSWQAITQDTYDTSGRLTKRVLEPTSNSAEWATWQYGYDANSDRTTVTDPKGNITRFCYDMGYDGLPITGSKGNLTRRIDPAAVPGTSQDSITPTTLYKYDSSNNLIQAVLPKSLPFLAVQCNTAIPSSSISPLYTIDLAYDASATQLLSVTRRYTDPDLGQQTATTKFEYADTTNPGRLTRVIPPRGNTASTPNYAFATLYQYYFGGSSSGMLLSVTDPLGNVASFSYDPVGRLVSMVDQLGNAPGGVAADHTTSLQYDNEDRLRFFRAPAPTSGGARLVTQFQYDAVGDRVAAIDANGQVRAYVYDERSLLSQVKEGPSAWTDPGTPPANVIVTAYAYDNLGRVSRVTRASGDAANERATDYAYDGLGRLRRESEYPAWPSTAGALVRQLAYDLNGNRSALTDAVGRTTTYAYDGLDRRTAVTYSDGVTPNVAYKYDTQGDRTSMTDGIGTTTYSYDELDRLVAVLMPSIGGTGAACPGVGTGQGIRSVGYRYDLDGDRTKLIYRDCTAVTYAYDTGGRLASLTDADGQVTRYQYAPDSKLTGVSNVDGTSAAYAYDNARRLTDVWNQMAAQTISRHTYTLDGVGDRVRADELLPVVAAPGTTVARSTAYGYDALYRLTSAAGPDVTSTYSYDPVGNRTALAQAPTAGGVPAATAYTYDRADRIQSAGAATYTSDANGNVTSRTGAAGLTSFSYDQADRLTAVGLAGTPLVAYSYDGDGVRRTTLSATPFATGVEYVPDVNRRLPVVLDDGLHKYVWGAGLAYDVALVGPRTSAVHQADGLRSTRALTTSGAVTQTYRYDEFGQLAEANGSSVQPYLYTGEPRDIESGLTFLRARYYDPQVGRFMSRDRWAGMRTRTATLSRYEYVSDNPVRFMDPSGFDATTQDQPSPSTTLDAEPSPARPDPWDYLAFGMESVGAAYAGYDSLRTRASSLGRTLRTAEDPALRSAAAGELPAAGRISRLAAKTMWRALGKALVPVGFGITFVGGLVDGEPWVESATRASLELVGSAGGGLLGGAACASETVATWGVGVVACPALVVGGGLAGGWLGDQLGDILFGPQ